MSAFGKLRQLLGRGADWLVGVMSGTVPISGLEGKNAYGLTVGLVVIGLGLGSWLIWRTITSTAIRPAGTNTNTTPIAELERLRNKDTDEDGLSDYTELFSLQTSPYLNDSDSDGIPDGQEISQGGDPNCPADQSCGGAGPVAVGSESNVSPAFLRQTLKAAGVPQSTLDALSDADIVRIYGEVATTTTNVNGTSNVNAAGPSLDTLQSLSADDIRQLMIEAGVDQTSLNEIDDATLKQIFNQAITSE